MSLILGGGRSGIVGSACHVNATDRRLISPGGVREGLVTGSGALPDWCLGRSEAIGLRRLVVDLAHWLNAFAFVGEDR